MNNSMKRRHFLSVLAGAAMLPAMPSFAISTDAAQRFVSGAIAELQNMMNSGQSGGQLQASVKAYFRRYADVPTVARAVIGAPWRGMNASQQQAYIAAFENYVTKKYAQSFDILRGGTAEIVSSRDGGNAGVLVNARFVRAGASAIPVDMQVSDQSGSPKVLDLKLNGVSLIGTEREQIRQMFAANGNNVDALIAALNAY